MSDQPPWHILTGEYPPQQGGVSDYTAQVAAGLASAGVGVHVWTSSAGEAAFVEGVRVHRIVGGWSPSDLAHLGKALNAFSAPRRLLVQYTPNAWGYRGLNLGFCRWLLGRSRGSGDEVRLMFHEVAYPWRLRDRPTRWVLAAGHRMMARTLLKASTHVDVTTPAWERLLRACAPGDARPIGWRPVPSNVPVVVDAEAVGSVRRRVAPRGEAVVGSFSSFVGLTGPPLAASMTRLLLGRPDRVGLLIGHGGDPLAARLIAEHPDLRGRLVATGGLPSAEVSAYLQASDVTIQPYLDGVTTRRTSLMASLAHGIAAVTNDGRLTEPFWADSGAVAFAEGVDTIPSTAERVLADPAERARIGAAGRELYARRFAIGRTVESLIGSASGASP